MVFFDPSYFFTCCQPCNTFLASIPHIVSKAIGYRESITYFGSPTMCIFLDFDTCKKILSHWFPSKILDLPPALYWKRLHFKHAWVTLKALKGQKIMSQKDKVQKGRRMQNIPWRDWIFRTVHSVLKLKYEIFNVMYYIPDFYYQNFFP